MEGGLEGKVYTLNEPTEFDGRGLTARRNESSIGSVDGELCSPAPMKIHVPPYSESRVPIRLVLSTGIRVRTTYLGDRYSIAIYIYAFRSGFWVGVSSFFFFFCVYGRYNRGLTAWFYLYRWPIWTRWTGVWKIFGEKLKERWWWIGGKQKQCGGNRTRKNAGYGGIRNEKGRERVRI